MDEFIEIRGARENNLNWIIDIGPEGGKKGGRVVFAGTPRSS